MTEAFDRLKTAVADRYAIERELGAGGMATVYLAHDLKHDRKVAIKVLRAELAATIGAERFLREIKIAAKLNHPHILAVHDSGEADGFLYYAMPYIEGESLRDRLARKGPLPLEEALQITREAASALAYAHEHGVIHRDIKPENILLSAGEAVVGDFGVARALSMAGGERLTGTGIALGTPAYMSPEQAVGDRATDARSDIYCLATVLYEMLAGDPPHTGSSAQAVIAKVVIDRPRPVRELRETVPFHVEAALVRALAKLPADRYATPQQFADALGRASSGDMLAGTETTTNGTTTRVIPRLAVWSPRSRTMIPWSLAVVAAGVAFWGWMRPNPSTFLARFVVTLPSNAQLVAATGPTLALSPDGMRFVYVGQGSRGQQLYVREMDQHDALPIPGTQGAHVPFFSPDGRWVGFVADGKLRKVPLAGGQVTTISDASVRGASWGPNDIIVLTPTAVSGLSRVSAAQGESEVITTPNAEDGEVNHRWPEILPGGKGVVFTIWTGRPEGARIAVRSLETGKVKLLIPEGTSARYVHSGHLVYAQADGSLLAVAFDPRRLEVTGAPVRIIEGIRVGRGGGADFSVSRNGALMYVPRGTEAGMLVVVDRQGAVRALTNEPRAFAGPRFSPGGMRVALSIRDGTTRDIWIYEMEQDVLSRLTFEGDNLYPVWAPDGSRVAFSSNRNGSRDLFSKPADGSGAAEPLLAIPYDQWPGSWSADGQWLVFRATHPTTGRDIAILPLNGNGMPQAFLQTPFDERSPMLSPDGRWLAYTSNESGRAEIYVRPFPSLGPRWQVSTDGGTEPQWARIGRELLYRSGTTVVAASIETEPAFRVVSRQALFEEGYVPSVFHTNYDIHPDGELFVMVKSADAGSRVVVVLNWLTELTRLVSGGRE